MPEDFNLFGDFLAHSVREESCRAHPALRRSESIEEAELWRRTVENCAPSRRREHLRWLALNDLYFLSVFLLHRWHMLGDVPPFDTGESDALVAARMRDRDKRRAAWCFARCTEYQAHPWNHLDLWSREHFKSEIITFAGNIQSILKDPNETVGLFSHTRPIAKGFLRQIKTEFEQNRELQDLFNDVLYAEPIQQAPHWGEDVGIFVKRKTNRKEATVEAWGLVDGQPTSKRFCVGAGSLVYTSNGLLPIQEIRPGTRVLNRLGRYTEVVKTLHTGTQSVLHIELCGQPDTFSCTSGHEVLAWREDGLRWVKAANLVLDDLLALPLPRGWGSGMISRVNERLNVLVCQPNIWRLIGYYLAKGNKTAQPGCIKFSFGSHETEYIANAIELVASELGKSCCVMTRDGGVTDVQFTDHDFRALCDMFGQGAKNKHIPPFAIARSYACLRELVVGYFRGDGHFLKNQGKWSATSISRSLLAGMQQILAVLHVPATIQKGGVQEGPRMVAGRMANCQQSYSLHTVSPLMNVVMGTALSLREQLRSPRLQFVPGFMLMPIAGIAQSAGTEEVYDLEVREGESFVINGACVHNSILSYDDVVSRKEITDLMIPRTTEEFQNSLLLTASDPVRFRYAATFQEIGDTTQQLIDRGFTARVRPGVTEDNKSLCLSDEKVGWFKDNLSPKVFALQILLDQKKAKGEHQLGFASDWLEYFVRRTINLHSLNKYILVDPAGESKQTDSHFALGVVGLSPDRRYKWLDGVYDKLNLDERTEALKLMCQTYQPKVVFYEKQAMQSDIEHIRGVMRKDLWEYEIVPVGTNQLSKDQRIEMLIPVFKGHQFHLPEEGIKYRPVHPDGNYGQASQTGEIDIVKVFVEREYGKWPITEFKDLLDMFSWLVHPDVVRRLSWPRPYGDKATESGPWGSTGSGGVGGWMAE